MERDKYKKAKSVTHFETELDRSADLLGKILVRMMKLEKTLKENEKIG